MQRVAPDTEHHALKAFVEPTTEKRVAPAFEDVLHGIGSRGLFQMRFNIVFVYIGGCFNMVSVYLFHFAMQTPDHWCHVPGREHTNFSLDDWKNFTVPKEGGSYSKCLMYNNTFPVGVPSAAVVSCLHGWDYDDRWFSLTVPSQMDWVCDRQHIVNDVIFYSQNLSIFLGLLFGYIGDMFGRRLLFFLCLTAHVVSRVALVLTPSVVVLFILAQSLVASVSGPMSDSSLAAGLELTDIKHRATVSALMCMSYGVALIITGLVAWVLTTWTHYLLFVAVCCTSLILFFRWFPESPRWLACRGREQEALGVLRRIAATNGTTVPPITQQVLKIVVTCKQERKGFLSIFSSWSLFRNTVLLIVARSVCFLTGLSLLLSVGGISVNPFVTASAQGAARIPANFVGHYCASRFGRRWSSVGASLLAAITGAAIGLLLTMGAQGTALTAATVMMMFFSSASYGITNLQSLEVHPTSLRQIAVCIECAASGAFTSLLPYIVFLGGSVDKRLPFVILAALNLVTAFSISFLPESALQKLPESLQDAAVFGKGRRYWSWKPKPSPSFVQE